MIQYLIIVLRSTTSESPNQESPQAIYRTQSEEKYYSQYFAAIKYNKSLVQSQIMIITTMLSRFITVIQST